jgi:endoglucanase
LKHPNIFAPNTYQGGGPYDDNYVKDEFFWAAAELFITTGARAYLDVLKSSPHFGAIPTIHKIGKRGLENTAMTWQSVGVLGAVSLSVVPNKLSKRDSDKLKETIVAAAESDLTVIEKEGYRLPLTSEPKPDYYWGSNFAVMNNLIILALADDFTGKVAYRNAVAEGMDYLLGKNTMDQCYVTGYGSRPLEHPHHRFWAHQANPTFPPPPPGAVSGGPNQHLEDPMILASVPGRCAPAACFTDHIESYSTNEVAINWNAAFAWLTAYLDDVAHAKR